MKRSHLGEPLPKVPSPPLSQFPPETPSGAAPEDVPPRCRIHGARLFRSRKMGLWSCVECALPSGGRTYEALEAQLADAQRRAAELEAAANAGYMHWIGIPYTELERRVRDVEDGKTIPHAVVMQRIRESWGAK